MTDEGFKNELGTDNQVGIKDDIGTDLINEQIKSYEKELQDTQKALDGQKKGLANYSEQWAIDKRLMELELEHFGKPEDAYSHNVHKVPEYWELQKKKFEFKVRWDTKQAEAAIEGYEKQIEIYEKNIERLTKLLEEAKNNLED